MARCIMPLSFPRNKSACASTAAASRNVVFPVRSTIMAEVQFSFRYLPAVLSSAPPSSAKHRLCPCASSSMAFCHLATGYLWVSSLAPMPIAIINFPFSRSEASHPSARKASSAPYQPSRRSSSIRPPTACNRYRFRSTSATISGGLYTALVSKVFSTVKSSSSSRYTKGTPLL